MQLIQQTLPQQCNGCKGVKVSLKRKEAFVEFDSNVTSPNDIATCIYDMGFDTNVIDTYPRLLSLSPLPQFTPDDQQVVTIDITGMVCQSCVQNIQNNIGQHVGIIDIKVSLEGNSATVTYKPSVMTSENICDLRLNGKVTYKPSVMTSENICNLRLNGMRLNYSMVKCSCKE